MRPIARRCIGRRRQIASSAVLVAIAMLGTMSLPSSARADLAGEREPGSSTTPAQADSGLAEELALRYAPILMLKEQTEECDSAGEPYTPIAVDFVLDAPNVALRQVGGGAVLMTAPGASDLFSAGSGVYLDFPGDALAPGCVYESDSRRFVELAGSTVYAHVAQEDGYPDRLAVQYWFFWYFNDWNNKHEGDWEGIQVLFEASSVEEALQESPISVGFAQHEGGEAKDWGDDDFERLGDHPVVYSSAGSHASYFGSAVYLGRSGAEGFGCDVTSGPSRRVEPAVVLLPDRVEDANDELAWLAFTGRWGEQRGGVLNGPTGPASKSRWTAPVTWHNELRNAGVQLSSGRGFGAEVMDVFCGLAERGSQVMIRVQRQPVTAILPLLAVGLFGLVLVRRTSWFPVVSPPLARRRTAGQILTSSARIYRRHAWPMLKLGIVFLPLSVASSLLIALVGQVPLVSAVVDLMGEGLVSVPFALVFGGVGNIVAQTLVISAVAALLADADGTRPLEERAPWHSVVSASDRLAPAVVRAYAIVFALGVSVIGLPWAIRQAVRYTFVPHAVVVEGREGEGAIDRSVALTQGQWWRTAWLLLLLGTVATTTAIVIALAVLLLAPGLPIWAFNLVTSLVLALVVPLSATATALLYGDLVARDEERAASRVQGVPAGERDSW